MDDKTFFKWFRRLIALIIVVIVLLFLTGGIKINIDRLLVGKFSPFEAAGRYHGYLIADDQIIGQRDMEDGKLLIYSRYVSGLPENQSVICIDFVEKTFFGFYYNTGAQVVFSKDEEAMTFVMYEFFPVSKDGLIVSNAPVDLIVDGNELSMHAFKRNEREVFFQRLDSTEMADIKFSH